MKYALSTLIAVLVLSCTMNAQTVDLTNHSGRITNFKASVENLSLLVKWTSTTNDTSDYWEVQGSTDGRSFSTIGMVMGASPKDANTYTFKQKLQNIKPGLIYFRVLHVEKDATAEVSNVIQSAK